MENDMCIYEFFKSKIFKINNKEHERSSYIIIQHDHDSFEVKRRAFNGDFHRSYTETLDEAKRIKKRYEQMDLEEFNEEKTRKMNGFPKEIGEDVR